MRTNRLLMAAAATVMAFALTGCGGDGGGDGAKVPTTGGGGSSKEAGTAGGGKDALAAYVEGKRAWVACMRENGIQLNDPDEKGRVDFGGGDAVRGMKKDPKFLTASEKCAPVDPPLPEDLESSLNPLTPEEIKARHDYADCMQKNGAPDFPDPGPDGRDDNAGSNADPDGPSWDQSSAGAKRAARVCGPIIGEPTDPPPAKG
ncbi:hypothetical protein ABZX98_27480 [Streptomyces sp. NPDC002992]|uniref:hypothetical protein n=1 Tax=Streptomyces sp. NPDC002992 TaxID=3154273 RepID=UPI0033BAEF7B